MENNTEYRWILSEEVNSGHLLNLQARADVF